MKITKHAQSCFFDETLHEKVLIDAGNFVFENEGMKIEDFTGTTIMVFTHEHRDHFDIERVVEIIKRNNPRVLATRAVAEKLKDFSKVEIVSAEYKQKFSDVTVEGFLSKHGPLPSGDTVPEVSGIVLDDGSTRFYAPGDTVSLDQKSNANIVATPFDGVVVMDINSAKSELLKLMPRIAIPIHYDNPAYPADVSDFEKAMEGSGIDVRILKWGESFETK